MILILCHVINGIFNEKVADEIYDSIVNSNKKWLYGNLGRLFKRFRLISFDNLAIEQLDVKRFLTDEE